MVLAFEALDTIHVHARYAHEFRFGAGKRELRASVFGAADFEVGEPAFGEAGEGEGSERGVDGGGGAVVDV